MAAEIPNIIDFPVLLTEFIFDYLPLEKLIHIDEVCRAWQALKPNAIGRRTRLNIVDRKEQECLPDKHSLNVLYTGNQGISPTLVERAIVLLPSLNTLTIISLEADSEELLKINWLLFQYQEQLVSVSLVLKGNESLADHGVTAEEQKAGPLGRFILEVGDVQRNCWRMYSNLVSTLNTTTQLKVLDLQLRMPFDQHPTPVAVPNEERMLRLNIASQLHILKLKITGFSMEGVDSQIVNSIFGLCENNPELQELSTESALPLEDLLKFGPRVLAAIREIFVEDPICQENLIDYGHFTEKCYSLRKLTLRFDDVLVAEVARALTNCPHLVFLRLEMAGYFLDTNEEEEEEDEEDDDEKEEAASFELNNNEDEGDANLNLNEGNLDAAGIDNVDLPVIQFPVLNSVTKLEMSIKTDSHRELEQMNLNVIFPQLQELYLKHFFSSCSNCGRDPLPSTEKILSRHNLECLRRARLPWVARFAHLKFVHLNIILEKDRSYKNIHQQIRLTQEELQQEIAEMEEEEENEEEEEEEEEEVEEEREEEVEEEAEL